MATATTNEAQASRRLRLRDDRASRFALYVCAAVSTVFIARTSVVVDGHRYFTLFDDAMISMTYARNLATGHGLVWVAGDPPVEGITNPAWTFYMAAWHLIGTPESLTAFAIAVTGAALVIASAVVARALVLHIDPEARVAAISATWLVALCYPLLFWSLRGTEVGVLSLLATWSALLALRLRSEPTLRDMRLLAVVGGLGVATRVDFLVVAAVVVAWCWWQLGDPLRRRVVLVGGGVPLATAGVVTVARWLYYGRLVPNTYDVKLGGIPLSVRLERGLSVLVGTLVFALVLALALAGLAWWMRRRDRATITLLAGIFLTQVGYSLWVGGDVWEWMRYANRFLTVGLVPLLVAAVLGIEALATTRRRAGATAVVALVCVAAVVGVVWVDRWSYWPENGRATSWSPVAPMLVAAVLALAAGRLRDARGVRVLLTIALLGVVSVPALARWWQYNAVHVPAEASLTTIGRVIEAATEQHARVAVKHAGELGYHTERPLVDLLGKSDEHIAQLEPDLEFGFLPGHNKYDLALSVTEHHPDVVAEMFLPTPEAMAEDVAWLEAAGYVEVGIGPELARRFEQYGERTFYARCDSEAIRWELLVAHDECPSS